MAEQRLSASAKKVQKMTEAGLVEKDLSKKTFKRVSKRLEDADLKTGKVDAKADISEKSGKTKPCSRLPSVKTSRLQFTSEENDKSADQSKRNVKAEGKNVRKADTKRIKEKTKRQIVYGEETKKKKSKIRFDEVSGTTEKDTVVPKKKVSVIPADRILKKAIIDGEEDDNSAVDAVNAGEGTMTGAYRFTSSRSAKYKRNKYERTHKLQQRSMRSKMKLHYQERLKNDEKLQNANALKRLIRKRKIKRQYAKEYRAKMTGGTAANEGAVFMKKASKKVRTFFTEHKGMVLSVVALVLVLVVVMTSVTSCTVGGLQVLSNIMAASYLSEPEEIEKAELYYTELEAALQKKINGLEKDYPGLDDYRYNIGEIGHDPHMLISYLSAKFEVFSFEQVKGEIKSLFKAQYGLSAEQVTETKETTKTVKVGESLGKVKTSGYCNCRICCGVWSGGPTASGAMPKGKHTIAVDANNPIVPMGTKIVMNGIEYTVEDTGNFARYGVAFDVYYDNHAAASAHGHRMWEAYLAEGNKNTVEVTKTETQEVLNVTVTTKTLRMIISERLSEEEKELYELIYSTKGNLQFCTTPIDLNWYSYIKSYYGYRVNPGSGKTELHRGIEISVTEGTEVKSGQEGTIVKTGHDDHYGYYVITEDEKGYRLKYAHLQSVDVTKGQSVTYGDIIGKTGSTGSVSGSQLYLELTKDGEYYNPIFYVETGEGGYGSGGTGAEYDDETVQRIFEEAEKYLGMPYVWGGSSPATSFDCSGFVSYVFTNSGVCNMGRLTAQGIYNICTPVDPADAKPGDIIFFTGTYSTNDPVTHVGIYAGDGIMIHCGNPIQYTSINSSYWQQHFYGFGRPSY